jgi:hypothetical protein
MNKKQKISWSYGGMIVNGIMFEKEKDKYPKRFTFLVEKTCGACPEQYDILFEGKKYYARLRWGYFYMAKECLEKPIYDYKFKDEFKGCFNNPQEEADCLLKALEKLISLKINKRRLPRRRRIKR